MAGQILKLWHGGSGQEMDFPLRRVIIAGWAGRNAEAVEHHIQELAELGVPRPKEIPTFYHVSSNTVTSEPEVQVVGPNSSGEVEVVLFMADGETYVGVGSDHTDRKLEAVSISHSKQVCVKPVGRTVWPLADVEDHWDSLVLQSHCGDEGAKPYQSGAVAALRPPRELINIYQQRYGDIAPGALMFCGTISLTGPLEYARKYTLSLNDPVLKRSLRHSYRVEVLPIVED